MQTPPPPSNTPPPGYGAPQKSGVPVWVWILIAVVGVCVIIPVGLAGVGLFAVGKAANQIATEASKSAKSVAAHADAPPAGWKRETVGEFTVDYPEGWTAVDPTDQKFIDAVSKSDASDPQTAQMKSLMQLGMSNKAYKLFLLHLPPDKATQFAPNINVVATPAPEGASLKELGDAAEAQIKSLSASNVKRESVQLAAGDAELIKSQIQSTTAAGKIQLDLHSYMLVHGTTGYVITVTIPSKLVSLDGEADSIVKTFSVK